MYFVIAAVRKNKIFNFSNLFELAQRPHIYIIYFEPYYFKDPTV